MALNPKLAETAVNAEADAVCALLNGGKLRIYDGAQAANADTEVGAQHLLVELTFPNPAFAAAAAGVAAANTIPAANAIYTATATWFRCLKADDTKVFDGSVGTATANIVLNSVAIQSGASVQVTALTFTAPKSA
jgi:hypothetical protein